MTTMLRTRTVLVIGRSAKGRALEAFDLIGHRALVLVTLGWPMTSVQRETVERAIDRCLALEMPIEALLAPDPAKALVEVRSDDEVHLFARGREARRLRHRSYAEGLVPAIHRS